MCWNISDEFVKISVLNKTKVPFKIWVKNTNVDTTKFEFSIMGGCQLVLSSDLLNFFILVEGLPLRNVFECECISGLKRKKIVAEQHAQSIDSSHFEDLQLSYSENQCLII